MPLFTTIPIRTATLQGVCSSLLCLSLLAWAGCDTVGSAGEETPEPVSVGFALTSPSKQSNVAHPKASTGDALTIEGTNGTLRIFDIRLIVSEMELKVDDDTSGEGPEFETPPSFLDLPLNATEIAPVANANIPEETYDGFEFEVEDVDPHDEDLSVERQAHLEALFDTIRTVYADWPEKASMVAVGTFTPTEGNLSDFRVYFDAEIEVELELNPPLEVTADGLSRSITVRIDPAQWLRRTDGTVINLAEFDYHATQHLYELEAEFEDGITEIEVDEHDEGGEKDDSSEEVS